MRKPATSRMMRSTSGKSATPSPSTRRASVTKPRPAWLTMKPGVSRAATAVWPMRRPSSSSAVATQGAVSRPSMTSTIFISGTGLKKWKPATRSGRLQAAAIEVTESEDVLVARMQSAAMMSSSCWNRRFLTSMFSTIASMTTFAEARSSTRETTSSLAFAAARAAGEILPFSASLPRVPMTVSRALAAAPCRASNISTRMPAWAAICAMPRPMAPVPTMPMQRSADRMSAGIGPTRASTRVQPGSGRGRSTRCWGNSCASRARCRRAGRSCRAGRRP